MTEQGQKPLGIALAAGAVFALAIGLRQAQTLFIGPLNSHTGAGYATISLAFGIAQLVTGIAQPLAGAVAERLGPRRVMIAGATLLAAANMATPFASNAVMLTLLIGVAAASGAGAIGPAMVISSANRWIPEAKRSMTTGIINAGGSFGQFTIIPLAQLLIGIAGWQPAMVILGVAALAAVPLAMMFAPAASACSTPGSSLADSTSLSSRPTFRASWRCAGCPLPWAPGRCRPSACSTSWGASGSVRRSRGAA